MLALLLNAEVYAPEALGRQHLLIAGGKLVWVGSRPPQVDRTLGVRVYDLEGRRLIPGLIDGHDDDPRVDTERCGQTDPGIIKQVFYFIDVGKPVPACDVHQREQCQQDSQPRTGQVTFHGLMAS